MSQIAAGPMISIRDLVVSYGGRRVLNGIDLDIASGETVVLLGGSGSGKSTVLRQIIGLEHPQSGSVSVNGINLPAPQKRICRSCGVRLGLPSRMLLNRPKLGFERPCAAEQGDEQLDMMSQTGIAAAAEVHARVHEPHR